MKKKNIIISIIVLILAAAIVIACGIGSQNSAGKWFQNPNVLTWFNSWGKDKPVEDDMEKDNISLASYALETADFAAYGISPQALEAKVITVNFEPANTTNKRIGWVCKWKDATSTWASGKNINDYVSFVPAADFGASATLAVKQPFGEPVIVTATSRANSALTSSSQFEYVARYSDLSNMKTTLDFGDNVDVFDDLYICDDYTVLPTECIAKISFTVDDELQAYLVSKNSDTNYEFVLENVTGAISWQAFIGEFNAFDYSDVAAYFLAKDYGGDLGVLTCEMTCKYTDSFGSEVVYTWTDFQSICFSRSCINEMSTPPTNITVNPGGGAF